MCLRAEGRTILRGKHSEVIVSFCATLDPGTGTDAEAAGLHGPTEAREAREEREER